MPLSVEQAQFNDEKDLTIDSVELGSEGEKRFVTITMSRHATYKNESGDLDTLVFKFWRHVDSDDASAKHLAVLSLEGFMLDIPSLVRTHKASLGPSDILTGDPETDA